MVQQKVESQTNFPGFRSIISNKLKTQYFNGATAKSSKIIAINLIIMEGIRISESVHVAERL